MSTIAAMRQAGFGDYELDNVVAIALTPSKGSPKLFVQDGAGGPWSAMMLECSSTSTSHMCTASAAVAGTTLGHQVTVQGSYKTGKDKTSGRTFETFYLDTIQDGGAAPADPSQTPLVLKTTDLARSDTSDGTNFFQKITVTPTEDILMYDWTPTELKYSGTATGCNIPHVFGFGMVPSSAHATAAAACTTNKSNPAGQTTPDMTEILIGTDFYKDFTVSSDCMCAGGHTGVTVPSATSKWPMGKAATGFLINNNGYALFSPTMDIFDMTVPPPTM
jgi:hypothetical protein